MSAQASVLTSSSEGSATLPGPRPRGEQSRGMSSGDIGCATGRGQGGDVTFSFLVAWALVRIHYFPDKSALQVSSVEMRMEQGTGGAGEW